MTTKSRTHRFANLLCTIVTFRHGLSIRWYRYIFQKKSLPISAGQRKHSARRIITNARIQAARSAHYQRKAITHACPRRRAYSPACADGAHELIAAGAFDDLPAADHRHHITHVTGSTCAAARLRHVAPGESAAGSMRRQRLGAAGTATVCRDALARRSRLYNAARSHRVLFTELDAFAISPASDSADSPLTL